MMFIISIALGVFGGLWLFARWCVWDATRDERAYYKAQRRADRAALQEERIRASLVVTRFDIGMLVAFSVVFVLIIVAVFARASQPEPAMLMPAQVQKYVPPAPAVAPAPIQKPVEKFVPSAPFIDCPSPHPYCRNRA